MSEQRPSPRRQETMMLRAWREIESRGLKVKAVRIGPDGAVLLLTESPFEDAPSDHDWVSLAGQPSAR